MNFLYFGILIFVAVVNAAVVPENVPGKLPAVESEILVAQKGDDFVLPEGFIQCNQDDPDLNQCIKNAVNQQLPLLHKGSDIFNIPPMDPLRVPDGRYQYASGPIGGTLIIKGVKVYGASKAILKKADVKILENGLTSTLVMYFPRLLVEGNYKADVKMNELKMRPKGYFNLTLSEVSVTATASGQFKIINGQKHLQITEVDIEPEIGDFKIYATGLFPDPTINNVVLDFANQYWPEIVKTVVPQTKPTWEPLVLENVNNFFGAVPFEKLLPKTNQ